MLCMLRMQRYLWLTDYVFKFRMLIILCVSNDMLVMVVVGGVHLQGALFIKEHLQREREVLWLEKEAHTRTR